MTQIEDAALDALAMKLRGRHGPDEAITAGELSTILSENTATSPDTRMAIKELMRRTDMTVVSCYAGYFEAEDDRDVAEYLANIQNRIDGMKERQRIVQENWHEQREATDDTDNAEPTAETTLSDFSGDAVATDGGVNVGDGE